MEFEHTGIDGLILVKPRAIGDERGFFMEAFRQDKLEAELAKVGVSVNFVQDNQAFSARAGVLRGLHFQTPPHAQAKYIGALSGAVFDVAVDLRRASPTYGKWRSFILSAANRHRLFIPAGFAHGYLTLEPDTEVLYKVDAYYAPENDCGIAWNDPQLAIEWPVAEFGGEFVLSEKDRAQPTLAEFGSPF